MWWRAANLCKVANLYCLDRVLHIIHQLVHHHKQLLSVSWWDLRRWGSHFRVSSSWCQVIVARSCELWVCDGENEKGDWQKVRILASITGENWTASNDAAYYRQRMFPHWDMTSLHAADEKPVKGSGNYWQTCNMRTFTSFQSANTTNR